MGTFRTSDGLNIAYEDWPADPGPEKGPPVVLHHGFLADGRLNWLYGVVVDKPHDPALYGEDRMSRVPSS